MTEDRNDIELRSEKVRNIIGQVPSWITRYGISLVSLIFCILIVFCSLIPITETYTAEARIMAQDGAAKVVCRIPYQENVPIRKGMKVIFLPDGHSAGEYGTMCCMVESISTDSVFCDVTLSIVDDSPNIKPVLFQDGKVRVVVKEQNLISRLLEGRGR